MPVESVMVGQGNIRRAQLLRNIARPAERRSGGREKGFAFGRERVRRLPDGVLEQEVEARLERGILADEAVQPGLAHGEQLGRDPGRCLAERRVEILRLRLLLLVGRDAHVRVGHEAGISVDAADVAIEIGLERQCLGQHVGAVAEMALVRGQALDRLERGLARGVPGSVVGIEFGEVPGGSRAAGRGAGCSALRHGRRGKDEAGERRCGQRFAAGEFGHGPSFIRGARSPSGAD